MLKIYFFLVILTKSVFCEDMFYNINNNYVLHKVNEKFLSISIDPAVLLAGANLSDVSLLLARHLSPAYIRLAGPSTPFVKYIDNEDDLISRKSEEGITDVIVTPSMWFGINEWLNLANLTPVFGINDNETDKGVWDPKSTLPLLEMSDKFEVTCYWQLGYDCSNKTTVQYIEDLNILRQTVNGFPEHNNTWKIAGSDLSRCILNGLDNHNYDNYISDLDENVDAIMWESSLVPKRELGFTKAALWTSIPKDTKPVTFLSAMQWAKQVGEAAKMEYDVVFRQPRLLEITHDTSVYWFSFLHKKLMGSNVLDIRPTSPNSELSTFAHCTKRQNQFVRTGAITIMMVNNGSDTNTANVRLGNIMLDKFMEVQSYLLTASDEDATEVYLNEQKLTMDMLKTADNILKPKLRRAKIRGHVSLEIPSKSIGFFVLIGAKNILCSNNEEDLDSILKEMNEDQNLSLSSEVEFKIEGRRQYNKKGDKLHTVGEKVTLDTIKKNILKEMELDKIYYNKMPKKQALKGATSIEEKLRDEIDVVDRKKETLQKHLRAFIEKTKKSDVSKHLGIKSQREKSSQPSNLYFTVKEIEEVLKKRARAKAATKNIQLTSSELDMLVDKATIRLPKHFISKRDINRLLLEEKANFHKNNMFSQETYEQYAKQTKLFPKFKYKRSEPNFKRIQRNINKKLLDLKSKLEEHKKYIIDRNNYLRNSVSNKHKGSLFRPKRDINLDLLKKRAGSTPSYDNHKIALQPSYLRNRKKYFYDDEEQEKYSNEMILGDSEELFPDFLESHERTVDDTKTPKTLFSDVANVEMDLSDFENYFKQSRNKDKINYSDLFYNPAFTRKSSLNRKINPAKFGYNELLRSSNEFENVDEEFQPCLGGWDFSFENPKESKSHKFTKSWYLNSPKIEKHTKGKSARIDFDDFIFSDNFKYGYLRKKRETNSLAKGKLEALTHDIKSKVKKFKKQVAKDKVNSIREKIKNKMELQRQNLIKTNNDRSVVTAKKNIQIIPGNKLKFENNQTKNSRHIISIVNSTENAVSSIDNRIKRSLMGNNLNSLFGQYQPLTTGLKPWKPIDILGFQNNYLNSLPLYAWLQNQNLKNTLLQNGYLWLRKRRYIDSGSINSIENEILSKEDQKEFVNEMGKTEFVKHPKEIVFKENKTNYLKTNNRVDKNNSLTIIKEKTTEKYFDSVVDKILPGEKMSYLEKIFGKQKIKPLENLVTKIKESFNNINKNVRSFFMNIF